jgi:predicted patatin/cPLA2 family phospholipase
MANPVLDVLRRRAHDGSRAPHGDGAKVALCIEGGSMRGVISAGMVVALEQMGWLECFDAVYGSSAGAMNGAYFVAGQAAVGATIYHDDINRRAFIDLLRPLRGKPILDLDFLVDDVMRKQKPLDTARVIASPVPLIALATDAQTGRRHLFRDFADGRDLLRALRAGATMPVFAGPPYAHRRGRYFDALLSEPIPVPAAEDDGHTHILALLTRPYSPTTRTISFTDKHLIGRRLAKVSIELGRQYMGRVEAYGELLAHIATGRGPRGRAYVFAIRPGGQTIEKLERRRQRLVDGAAAGLEAVMTAITDRSSVPIEARATFDVPDRRFHVRPGLVDGGE